VVAVLAAKAVTGQQVTGLNFSLISRLPDDDTKEATLYGSSYTLVKAALFNLARMEHILAMRAEKNVNELCKDKDFSKFFDEVRKDPYARIPKDKPGYETKTKIQEHIKYRAGINWCKSKTIMVKMYGRLIGTQEQGVKLKESPEQLKIWRDSVLQLASEPLDYRSIEEEYV